MTLPALRFTCIIARTMGKASSRRRFITGVASLLAAGVPRGAAQSPRHVRGFDHVALPMENTDAMIAFYRGLGLEVFENANACSVYIGDQMINFHRPARWRDETFTLRARAAEPPCGDLCFVWDDTPETLKKMLQRAGAKNCRGSRCTARRPEKESYERIRSRPRWEPPRIHDLLMTSAGCRTCNSSSMSLCCEIAVALAALRSGSHWTYRRLPFPYPITEGLPVTRDEFPPVL